MISSRLSPSSCRRRITGKKIKANLKYKYAGLYVDEGTAGTNTVHREAFYRLIRDCVEEKTDLILVKSISRFSRNASECQHYTYLLKNLPHPVKILFETEGIDSFDENAEMAIQMHAIIAQGESRARSKNVRWGKIRRYQSGKVKFSTHNLLGYDKDSEGEIMIDEDEAPVIRAIFRMYMSAYSSSEIADILNRNGIPSPGGKIWSSGSVLSILKNEKYCGDVIGQKTYTKDYISHKVLKNKPRTTERYWTDIRLHIVPYIDTVRLQDLTAPMLQKFINQCRSSGISAKSVRNLHGVLHEALAQAVRCELINKNVSELCLLPKAIKPEMHPLKDEKVKEFLEAIKGHRYEDMYFFMMFTGLRESEAIGLMWDCVDLERGKITVNKQLQKAHSSRGKVFFSTPKNGKSRTFTVAPSVIQVLKRVQLRQTEWRLKCGSKWQNDDNLVFTTELGKHVSCHTLYNNFKEIVRSIGVPETRLHDLRHTFATLALQNDVDIKTVAFTLDRYGHMTETMQQHASDRMQSFIEKLG